MQIILNDMGQIFGDLSILQDNNVIKSIYQTFEALNLILESGN